MRTSKPRLMVCSVDSFPQMGGVSTLAYEVTNALIPLVDECVYLGPRGLNFGERKVDFHIYEDWESDMSLRAGSGAQLEDERISDLMTKIIKSYRLDGIIAFHPFYYGPSATRTGNSLGLPAAIMVHGTELTSQFPDAIRGEPSQLTEPNSLAGRLLQTLQDASSVVSNSTFTAEIVRTIVPSVAPYVIGCGLPVKQLDHLVQRTPNYQSRLKTLRRQRLGLSKTPMIAYVGRLVAHKNLSQLIDLGSLTGYQIVIMGRGPLRNELEALATSVSADVKFEDDADDDRKWQLLEAADYGYLMSNHNDQSGGFEGFGISMLEYCAAGAVCITSGEQGMVDFAEDGLTTVDPRKSDGSLDPERIVNLLADDSAMDLLVQASRSRIRDEFTWDRVAMNLMQALA